MNRLQRGAATRIGLSFIGVVALLVIGPSAVHAESPASYCQCTTFVARVNNLTPNYPNASQWGNGYLQGNGYSQVSEAAAQIGDIVVFPNKYVDARGIQWVSSDGHVGIYKGRYSGDVSFYRNLNGFGPAVQVYSANQWGSTGLLNTSPNAVGCNDVSQISFPNTDVTFWHKGVAPTNLLFFSSVTNGGIVPIGSSQQLSWFVTNGVTFVSGVGVDIVSTIGWPNGACRAFPPTHLVTDASGFVYVNYQTTNTAGFCDVWAQITGGSSLQAIYWPVIQTTLASQSLVGAMTSTSMSLPANGVSTLPLVLTISDASGRPIPNDPVFVFQVGGPCGQLTGLSSSFEFGFVGYSDSTGVVRLTYQAPFVAGTCQFAWKEAFSGQRNFPNLFTITAT